MMLSSPRKGLFSKGSLVYIEGRARDRLGLQRFGEILLVDDAAPGGVDDPAVRFHFCQLRRGDHVVRLFRLGGVNGDKVGIGQQRVEIDQFHAQAFRFQRAENGVVGQYAHLESLGALGNGAADTAHADDAQRLAEEFGAHELLAVPAALFHGGVGVGDVAAEAEHECEGVLTRGNRVAAGRVHDYDALLRGGILVDIVRAHAGAPDYLEAGGIFQRGCGHLRGAPNHQPVIVVDDGRQFLFLLRRFDIGFNAGLAKQGHAFFTQVVQHQYAQHGYSPQG